MAAPFTVLVMAAGQGTRMRSEVPKVLHRVAGKTLVEWVVDAAREAGAGRVIAIVRPGDGVAGGLPEGVEVVEQREGEGTGSAVLAARLAVLGDGDAAAAPRSVFVLSGDQPLITADQLEGLIAEHDREGAVATLLTTDQLDPAGFGRVVRDGRGHVERIFETKHTEGLSREELAVREVNLGTYVFDANTLFEALDQVGLERDERYLTGVFPVIRGSGGIVAAHVTDDADAAIGVNDRVGLMRAEEAAQRRLIERHALEGVTFLQPGTTRVEAGVTIGRDTVIGPGTVLEGGTSIGERCEVTYAVIRDAEIHDDVKIGPFAYIRPGTVVHDGAKVGTSVEIKNSDIGAGSKVPHLSYIGDADVGEGSNLGASTITANYDGRQKNRTKIGKSVKTSVHTSLVAPLHVGDRAYTGASSAITEDVPDGALAIARQKQKNIEGYADRKDQEDSQK
jgi:bifunctional UDP-N-acetylglucosamine pyrophosphorylase / glucosamine-1-phosphate N-acetyltransferase